MKRNCDEYIKYIKLKYFEAMCPTFNSARYRWVLGTEVIKELRKHDVDYLIIGCHSHECTTLFNIIVEPDKVNPYKIKLYREV